MSLIHATNINVIRQGRSILSDVSLSIDEHDFITIIGPNGAGKSTLIQCLMGFFPPDSGSIIRHDTLRIGYVPQRIQQDSTIPITARRFLTLGQPRGDTEFNAFFERICEETQTTSLLERSLHVLSGGEMQRILLARALLRKPNLLMLDEPAQNLDVSSQIAFYKLLEHIYERRKISILMVSHDLHLVMASTRKVICLYHHICCSGEPHAVTQDPEFSKLFGQDITAMMAIYHHQHSHQHDHASHADHLCDHDHHHAEKEA
jgi:zinc transport system ATP-binding protein